MAEEEEARHRAAHVWSSGCEICDDALNSGHVRCNCRWSASGHPPLSHNSSCAVTAFESNHGENGRTKDETRGFFGVAAKRLDDAIGGS